MTPEEREAVCPECRVKSLAMYQDKYGISAEEWTLEQAMEAMRSIHYERLEWARKEREAYERGFNECREKAAKVAEARCQCPHHISIGYEIRALKPE